MVRTLGAIVFACAALGCSPHAEAPTTSSMPLDVAALWDFRDPELSEERFRAALETASGDNALILQAQIARTYALRQDFEKAREVLQSIEPRLEEAGPEARVRYWLELGRTYASHRHPEGSQTPETSQHARDPYMCPRRRRARPALRRTCHGAQERAIEPVSSARLSSP